MSNKQLAVLVAAIVFVFGGPPLAYALSAPLGDLKNCNDITVSSAVLSSKTCMGSFGSSITVQNDSATCIRVGGTAVTATTGLSVGTGCAAGAVVTFDAKEIHYISSGADVTGVDIVWGMQ
jgi:hypothetical protein